MQPDQERLSILLKDTIMCLCRNGLQFDQTICVQGLLGITKDNGDVFIVHINELITSSDSSYNHQLQMNVPKKTLVHVRPTKRPYQREGFKLTKKKYRQSIQPSGLQSSLVRSETDIAECNIQESTTDILGSPDDEVQQQPEKWMTEVDLTNRSIEAPIEIKAEPDVDSSQFEQLLDFSFEQAGQLVSTYATNHDDSSFHDKMSVLNSPIVSTRSWQKHSNRSYDPLLDNDASLSTRARTSLISHQFTTDYAQGYESSHCSNWNPDMMMSFVSLPNSRGKRRAANLNAIKSSKKLIQVSHNDSLSLDSSRAARIRQNSKSSSKPFVCFCGKSFFHKPNFYRHRRFSHPEYHYSQSRFRNKTHVETAETPSVI